MSFPYKIEILARAFNYLLVFWQIVLKCFSSSKLLSKVTHNSLRDCELCVNVFDIWELSGFDVFKDSNVQKHVTFAKVSFHRILGKPLKLLFNYILIQLWRTPISSSRKLMKEKIELCFVFFFYEVISRSSASLIHVIFNIFQI